MRRAPRPFSFAALTALALCVSACDDAGGAAGVEPAKCAMPFTIRNSAPHTGQASSATSSDEPLASSTMATSQLSSCVPGQRKASSKSRCMPDASEGATAVPTPGRSSSA